MFKNYIITYWIRNVGDNYSPFYEAIKSNFPWDRNWCCHYGEQLWQFLNGQEFEQTPEAGEGQGSLACCSPWGQRESDTTW